MICPHFKNREKKKHEGEIAYISPFLFYFVTMKSTVLFSFILLVVSSMFSCSTQCYNCRKYVSIEVDGEVIETDNYFEENTCEEKRKESLELEDFVCSTQR